MKRILVTGSAGFAGSHFCEHILENTDWEIVGLDSFRHRGDSLRVQPDMDPKRYTVHCCDLSAPISHRVAALIGKIDYIVNFASESHVERSITDPVPFVQNNVNLMLSILEYARIAKPEKFLHISTDEVYGPADSGVWFKEWDRHLPSNPYSASKSAQEAIAISYWRTYGVPLIITNTMNLFGARQDPEKFIPMVIAKVARNETVTIHGRPGDIGSRFYLHARNQADAVLFGLQRFKPTPYGDRSELGYEYDKPLRYNIVGDTELTNLEVAQSIARLMEKDLKYAFVDFHTTRPGHDRRYALDGKRLAVSEWKQPHSFVDSLKKTIEWTLAHPEWSI